MTILPEKYEPPTGISPLILGILTTTHERHLDMLALVRDLPANALAWRPGQEMSSLSGLVRHMMDDETEFIHSIVGMESGWPGTNGEFMDATDEADILMACIVEGDTLFKKVYITLTDDHLLRPHPKSGGLIGRELIEVTDHAAMHYGQMQLTRHLWAVAHPEFSSAYEHWR